MENRNFHYEAFQDTLLALSPGLENHRSRQGLRSNSGSNERLIEQCKKHQLSMAGAVCLVLKKAFENFCRTGGDTLKELENEEGVVPLYKLDVPALQFELFLDPEDLQKDVRKVFQTGHNETKSALFNVIENRFYLMSAGWLRQSLSKALASAPEKADKVNSKKLQQKLTLEQSCKWKGLELVEAQGRASEIRGRFCQLFPEYRREWVLRSKSEVLREFHRRMKKKLSITYPFVKGMGVRLADAAGAKRKLDEDKSSMDREDFVRPREMDAAMLKEFHGFVVDEITEIIQLTHPDKNVSLNDGHKEKADDLSSRAIQLKKLTKLGPGSRTFFLLEDLRRIKRELSLIHPDKAEHLKNRVERASLDDQIHYWSDSEKILEEHLLAVREDKELQQMNMILNDPSMHEGFKRSLKTDLGGHIHTNEQLLAEKTIRRCWSLTLKAATKVVDKPTDLAEFKDG